MISPVLSELTTDELRLTPSEDDELPEPVTEEVVCTVALVVVAVLELLVDARDDEVELVVVVVTLGTELSQSQDWVGNHLYNRQSTAHCPHDRRRLLYS